jgi:signal transduction histidine kinase
MADQPGRLGISARQQAGSLVFEVWDTGPGIPKHIEGSLFQSFVTANKVGGTGLGLAIVKKAVEEHGGSIEVESSESGAKFRIAIPQVGENASGTGADNQSPKSARRNSSRPPPRTNT